MSLEKSTPSPEKERIETVTNVSDADCEGMIYKRSDGTIVARMWKPCDDDIEGGFLGTHLGVVGHMTQDFRPEPAAPPAPTSRPPKPDFLASSKGPSFEVRSQEHQVSDVSPTIQINSNHTEQPPLSGSAITPCDAQFLALTDEQCRMIQALVDPNGIRRQKDWETPSQLKLIRLYMTGWSFPRIEAQMPELDYS